MHPVDAAHELAPADHLAQEALQRGDRHRLAPLLPRRRVGQGGRDHRRRRQQADVEQGREQGVVQGGVVLAEGVFKGPEAVEALRQEALQPGRGAGLIEGDPQGPQRAGVIGEVGVDQGPHRRLVGAGRHRRQGGLHVALGQLAAVLHIEAPAATGGGAVGFQQQAEAAPLALVEGLHERAATALEPAPALGHRFQKRRRRQHAELHPLLGAEPLQPGLEAAVGHLGHLQRATVPQFSRQPLPERHRRRIRQLEVGHRHAPLQQRVAETAHRHEGVQQPQAVVPPGGGHGQVLDHQHPLAGGELQRRGTEPVGVELVAQDQGEGHGVRLQSWRWFCWGS